MSWEGDTLGTIKKLPDAEFDIMKVIWANKAPVTTSIIMQQLGSERSWKAQTVVSLMLRLAKRGFIRSEKNGKENLYFPLIEKNDYLNFETSDFIERFHGNSFTSLVARLYDGNKIKDIDLDQLTTWLKEKKE